MEERITVSDEELFQLYLAMSKEQRERRFANTATAADLIGISQRTVQFWIETGAVRAIPIGGRFKVDLESLKEYLKTAAGKHHFGDYS